MDVPAAGQDKLLIGEHAGLKSEMMYDINQILMHPNLQNPSVYILKTKIVFISPSQTEVHCKLWPGDDS